MYGITKTRMLLTTVVFGRGQATMFAAGASAGVRANRREFRLRSAGVARDRPLRGLRLRDERGVAFSVEEICAALGLEQLRGVLINEDAIRPQHRA